MRISEIDIEFKNRYLNQNKPNSKLLRVVNFSFLLLRLSGELFDVSDISNVALIAKFYFGVS